MDGQAVNTAATPVYYLLFSLFLWGVCLTHSFPAQVNIKLQKKKNLSNRRLQLTKIQAEIQVNYPFLKQNKHSELHVHFGALVPGKAN